MVIILNLSYGPINEKDKSSDSNVQPTIHRSLHIAFLKWLIVVFPFFADPQIVTKLYSTLFTKIPYESTRPYVCQLLYLATTQALVVPWRCKLLVEYYTRFPNSPVIIGLLQLYKSYAPFIFRGAIAQINPQRVFPHPNVSMELQIRKIHDSLSNNSDFHDQQQKEEADEQLFNKNNKRYRGKDSEDLSARKRPDPSTRIDANDSSSTRIPQVSTTLQTRPAPYLPTLAIENIMGTQEFVLGYHKLKFPDRIGSVFGNTNGMLLQLLLYKGTAKEWSRLNSWLLQQLYDCVQWASETPGGDFVDDTYGNGYGGRSFGVISKVVPQSSNPSKALSSPSAIVKINNNSFLQFYLEKIHTFYSHTQKLPESAEEFLYSYLPVWDGVAHSKIMKQLISLLPFRSANVIETQILGPLRRILDSNFASRHIYVYELLGMLIGNWKMKLIFQQYQEFGIIPAHESDNPSRNTWFLKNYEKRSELFKSLQLMCTFVDYYGLFSAEQFPDNTSVSLSIITFFKKVTLFQSEICDTIVLPMSSDLFYHLFLSQSGVVLSKICELLRYWRYLMRLSYTKTPKKVEMETQSMILDVCNCLWLNRAFSNAEERENDWPSIYIKEGLLKNTPQPSLLKLHPQLIVSLKHLAEANGIILDQMFFLSYSPIFSLQTALFWRRLEEQNAPFKPYLDSPPDAESIAKNAAKGGLSISTKVFKKKLLEEIGRNQFIDIKEILTSSLKVLSSRRQSRST